jgi:hypothetical protein
MTHARYRHVRPSGGNAATIVVILVIVVGVGVGIYMVMQSGAAARAGGGASAARGLTPSPTVPVAATPPPPVPAVETAGPTRVSGVEQEYDPRHDRLKVIARGIPLEESVGERWSLDVSWTTRGRAILRPTTPLVWVVVHQGAYKSMENDNDPALLVDGKPIDAGAGSYGGQSKGDSQMEALRFSTNVEGLLAAAAATTVRVRAGSHSWELGADAMERLRGLASLVPPR